MVLTVDVLMINVNVMKVGTVKFATQSCVTQDVMIMVSARMERACASLDGMESIARLKVVLEGKDQLILNQQLINEFVIYSCSNHGQCRVGGEGLFECRCNDGWDGIDCSLALEKDCKDGKDNDKGENQLTDSVNWYSMFFLVAQMD